MTTEVFTDRAAFVAAIHGTPRQKRGRATRPDIPSAPRAAATGLTSLIAPKRDSGRPAWSVEYCVGSGYRLFVIGQPQLDTGYCASEKQACDAARGLR